MKPVTFILLFSMLFIIACKTPPEQVPESVPAEDMKHELPEQVQPVSSKDTGSHYCIIAFDGGGMKGALTAKILLMLEQAVPRLLYNINLYAGTSSGGIITLSLAHGKTPQEILDFYLKNGEKLYAKYPVPPGFDQGINRPFYTFEHYKTLLEEQFPRNPALSSLQTDVVVPSFMIDEKGASHPVYFHNFAGSPYSKERVTDVALRTCADPVYFPDYQGYIGAGMFTANPSLAALSAALDPELGKAGLENVRLLSLGTGTGPMKIEKKDEDWGAAQWINPYGKPAIPLLQILMIGTGELNDYHCRMILGDKYMRFNVLLDKNYAVDDWKNVSDLVKEAGEYVITHQDEWQELINWIEEIFL
ncbi:MAG: patatin-like phospholipase family protein [Spirochaetales bacterium]|nr:patatin-like phospholipase family protein [Spirochaetales bacterium]